MIVNVKREPGTQLLRSSQLVSGEAYLDIVSGAVFLVAPDVRVEGSLAKKSVTLAFTKAASHPKLPLPQVSTLPMESTHRYARVHMVINLTLPVTGGPQEYQPETCGEGGCER